MVVVLGDRSRSDGIELFELNMARLGLEALLVNKADELSEYVFRRAPAEAPGAAAPPEVGDVSGGAGR